MTPLAPTSTLFPYTTLFRSFPELYRILAVRGARIIAVPAAFTLATTRDHWETLLRARAIENQAFVIAANQVGAHGDRKSTRLNSSHVRISYAVFCLKKKK